MGYPPAGLLLEILGSQDFQYSLEEILIGQQFLPNWSTSCPISSLDRTLTYLPLGRYSALLCHSLLWPEAHLLTYCWPEACYPEKNVQSKIIFNDLLHQLRFSQPHIFCPHYQQPCPPDRSVCAPTVLEVRGQ